MTPPPLVGCVEPPRVVRDDDEDPYTILEPYFVVVKKLFVPDAPLVKSVRLEIDAEVHDTPRHFAAWDTERARIVVAPQMADFGYDTVFAIFAHEFGHAVDFLYPGAYSLADGELVKMPALPIEAEGKRARQAVKARLRWWQDRDDDTIERTADAIGELYLGEPIGYCGPCLLQCFGGPPRPAGLR